MRVFFQTSKVVRKVKKYAEDWQICGETTMDAWPIMTSSQVVLSIARGFLCPAKRCSYGVELSEILQRRLLIRIAPICETFRVMHNLLSWKVETPIYWCHSNIGPVQRLL